MLEDAVVKMSFGGLGGAASSTAARSMASKNSSSRGSAMESPAAAEMACAISARTLTLSDPSRSACSVRSSLTTSWRSLVLPSSLTVPSTMWRMTGACLGSGLHVSTTSTSATSSCRLRLRPRARLFPDCHVAFSSAAGPSPSITTYLYSYVSSAWIGVVTVHTFPSVHTIGNAAEMSQSFHVPTMATRWPGRVSTAISNLTGMSMSPDL
mmetsp:Transcript_4248/g.17490  ORF Transcript_4248/g.17490 Transcript_4248/m.17490 type:complete len:210 (-) Transcript_4248:820-1449(-)